MGVFTFVKDYFLWHYSVALKERLIIWKNFLWFVSQFFSIGLLLRTLIQPWRRMREYAGRGFDPQKFFETLIINLMMRLVGFILRIMVISIGFAVLIVVFVLGALELVFWFGLPFFLILFLSRGLMIFF